MEDLGRILLVELVRTLAEFYSLSSCHCARHEKTLGAIFRLRFFSLCQVCSGKRSSPP